MKLAIDNVLANRAMMRMSIKAEVTYDRYLSDHYPVDGTWTTQDDMQGLEWRWPKAMKIQPANRIDNPWHAGTTTYGQWSAAASKWIADRYQTQHQPEMRVTTTPHEKPKLIVRVIFTHIKRLQGLLCRYKRTRERPTWTKIRRYARIFEIPAEGMNEIENHLAKRLTQEIVKHHEIAIKRWTCEAEAWKPTTAAIYRYMRNPMPATSLCVQDRKGSPCYTTASDDRRIASFLDCPRNHGQLLVAHDCGYPLSRCTCRATHVAADFLDFIVFCRCSTGVALHPLKILVLHLAPPPVPGGVAPKFGSEKVSRYTGVSQLQLRVSRYTVQLRAN